jgi:hypothetical protein
LWLVRNCRHGFSPWFEGLRNPYVDENGNLKIDSEENRKAYETMQKQRAMERSIRKNKRQLLMKQEEIDAERDPDRKKELQSQYDSLAYKLTQKNGRYNDFCEDNNLQPQYERNKVADFGRDETKTANKAAKRYIKDHE